MSLLPLVVLGFFLGMRHATDPDHVLAVTTIVAQQRKMRGATLVGAIWGAGHTLTVLLVGGAIIVFGLVIPPRLGLTLELVVAAMLVVLGWLNLSGFLRSVDQLAHEHHVVPAKSAGLGRFVRPLAIGLVHGLAGSAAVALLVLGTVHDALAGVAYLALFCVGTVAGMTVMTSALAVPFVAFGKSAAFQRRLAQGTGAMSILFGLFLAYQVGITDGLFSGHPVWAPH